MKTGPVILLYHRVAEAIRDPWELCVSPAHFRSHLEALSQDARVVPLLDCTRPNVEAQPAVSITFDDGYIDNLTASKLLEEYGLPATFFVMTAGLHNDLEPWWDELGRVVSPDAYLGSWQQLHSMSLIDREDVIAALFGDAGIERSLDPHSRLLRAQEVAQLAASRLMEIGAHTQSHPSLATLGPANQLREIIGSKRELEQVVGRRVTSFAYPFGTREHYSGDTIQLVRAAGFKRACANGGGTVQPDSSHFALPRVHVPDCDGDGLLRLIAQHRCGG
jgi:peptidoglycan/xylan/chitin deacetylase (PgdA/CDA1 family)